MASVLTGSSTTSTEFDGLLDWLSQPWRLFDWDQLPAPKRQAAAAMIEAGVLEVRLACRISKDGLAMPLEAMVVASGDFWPHLKQQLAELADSISEWEGRSGPIRYDVQRVGLRLTAEGEQLRQDIAQGLLDSCRFLESTTVPAAIQFESHRFAESEPTWQSHEEWTSDPTPLEPRHWTQANLDRAIARLWGDDVIRYFVLRDGIQDGWEQSLREARAIFGRNAIARRLGVRGKAMISKSPIWQQIAVELDLHSVKRLKHYKRVKMKKALTALAEHDESCVSDELSREETREQIERRADEILPRLSDERAERFREIVEAIKASVETGTPTGHRALEVLELAIQQFRDGNVEKIRVRP